MKTKYKRIIKIFIFILLISANICSYAAVSSDGSAFVTGEEFSEAISDFNRRLTVFQAGINSKIDSQVSSYLDRNGIWNAFEQTTEPVPTDSFGWYADTAMTAQRSYVWVNGKYYDMGKDQAYKLSSYDMDEVIVNKIQKAGLACVTINFSQVAHGVVAFNVYNATGESTIHQDRMGGGIICDEYIAVTDNTGKEEDKYNINWVTYFPAPANYRIDYPKQLSAYIFVNLNDKVTFRFKGQSYETQTPLYCKSEKDYRIKINDWSVSVY